MERLNVLTAGLLLITLTACTSDLPTMDEKSDNIEETTFLKTGINEALEMMALMEQSGTRSKERTIKHIEKIQTHSTRSNEQAPEWYVVNFENEDGFAIVTDADIPSRVYGVSNEGHLNVADTAFNPGLKYVIQNLENNPKLGEYPDDIITNGESAISKTRGLGDLEPFPGASRELLLAPLLTETVCRWHQWWPFNQLSPIVDWPDGNYSAHAPAGCVPLAMEMIMTHYKYPHSYYSPSMDEIYEFDWDGIRTADYKYVMSRIIRELSRQYNLDVDWKYSGSGAKASKIPDTFNHFGYLKPTIDSFVETGIIYLSNQVPVLVVGANAADPDSGHAWVADGLLVAKEPSPIDGMIYCNYLYHCVWGWEGNCNGYFRFGEYVCTSDADSYDGKHTVSHTYNTLRCIGKLSKNPAYGQMD